MLIKITDPKNRKVIGINTDHIVRWEQTLQDAETAGVKLVFTAGDTLWLIGNPAKAAIDYLNCVTAEVEITVTP